MKIYLILAASLLSLHVSAQTETPKHAPVKVREDTARLRFGNTRILFINGPESDSSRHKRSTEVNYEISRGDSLHHKHHGRKNPAYWTGFGLGFNGFLTQSGNLKMPKGYEYLDVRTSRISTVTLNVFERAFPVYKHNLSFVTGLGFEWNNYFFRKSFILLPGVDSVQAAYSSRTMTKNKLVVDFVNIPLLLEYHSSDDHHAPFHVAGGVILGYIYRSHSKQKYEDGSKYKDFDNFNMLPYRCSATLRAGYGSLTVFANYALTDMFISGTAPELHAFSLGIAIGG